MHYLMYLSILYIYFENMFMQKFGDIMNIETINIKNGFPPADVAVANMEIEIDALTFAGKKAVKVIHGYGSHGVGGEIKKQAHARLVELKKEKKILLK